MIPFQRLAKELTKQVTNLGSSFNVLDMPLQSIPHLTFNQPNPSLSKRHNFNLLSHQVEYLVFFNCTSINNSTRRLVIKTTWCGVDLCSPHPPFTKKKKDPLFPIMFHQTYNFQRKMKYNPYPKTLKSIKGEIRSYFYLSLDLSPPSVIC